MNSLSLGIPGVDEVRSGTHLCALYAGPDERDRLLFPFLDEGMRRGDKVLCLTDDMEPAHIRARTETPSAQLDVEWAEDVYLGAGEFSVDLMIEYASAKVDAAVADRYEMFRAVGEMSWALRSPDQGKLFAYESALNTVVHDVPAVFMCLYDLTQLGAESLVEVLRTHPTVLLDHAVTDNAFYRGPTEYRHSDGAEHVGGRDDHWESLTPAELRVVVQVSRGITNRMIAVDLHGSPHTVDAHLKHIYVKLDIHSRVELTVLALQHSAYGS